jgi:ABC-type nitrate/sulfonate/bicarbonate transport system ATPase subunit
MNEEYAVRAERMGKRYRSLRGLVAGGVWALADCSFDVPAGRIAALVGANGAGKTTLLGIVCGLLRPTSGRLEHNGRVAFVAQEKPLYRDYTVTDMLRFGRHSNEVWDQRRAEQWLERFAVPRGRRCRRLSSGQQAQVALAVALGARPDVLLLDEPLANLDPLARREVMGELLAEVAETGTTVVLSTHIVTELMGIADHLLLLAAGRRRVHPLRFGHRDRDRSSGPPGPSGDRAHSRRLRRPPRAAATVPVPAHPARGIQDTDLSARVGWVRWHPGGCSLHWRCHICRRIWAGGGRIEM